MKTPRVALARIAKTQIAGLKEKERFYRGEFRGIQIIDFVVICSKNRDDVVAQIAQKVPKNLQGIYCLFAESISPKVLAFELESFRAARDVNRIEAVPKPNSDSDKRGKCLYVGRTKRSNLQRRLICHLAYRGTHRTSALKLNLWALERRTSLKVRVLCFPVASKYQAVIGEMEEAFFDFCKPSFGKLL